MSQIISTKTVKDMLDVFSNEISFLKREHYDIWYKYKMIFHNINMMFSDNLLSDTYLYYDDGFINENTRYKNFLNMIPIWCKMYAYTINVLHESDMLSRIYYVIDFLIKDFSLPIKINRKECQYLVRCKTLIIIADTLSHMLLYFSIGGSLCVKKNSRITLGTISLNSLYKTIQHKTSKDKQLKRIMNEISIMFSFSIWKEVVDEDIASK